MKVTVLSNALAVGVSWVVGWQIATRLAVAGRYSLLVGAGTVLLTYALCLIVFSWMHLLWRIWRAKRSASPDAARR